MRRIFLNKHDRLRGSWIFCDNYGLHGFGILLVATLAVTLCIVGICLGVKVVNESACNTEVQQYSKVRDGDYKFWNDECFMYLKNGKVVPASRYRVSERGGEDVN